MGLSALLSRLVRNSSNTLRGQIKFSGTSPAEESMQNFLESLSSKAKFNAYSQEAKYAITDFVQIGDTKATSFIKTLIDNSAEEKDILTLLKEPEKFNLYKIIKVKLNKLLQGVKFDNPEERSLFSQNLSLLRIKDKSSFLNLTESKGFKEILEGSLSSEYIRDLKSTDKIGYNHFYDLFADIEKVTDSRLSKIKGLDKEEVITLIKSMDKEICESPKILEDLLVMIEKHKNPDSINKILKIFQKDIEMGEYNSVKGLIMQSDSNPELFNKVLNLHTERHSLHSCRVLSDIESLLSKENKIDAELLKYLADNKEAYSQFGMSDINNFLNIEDANTNMLKKFMNALNELNEKKHFGYDLESVSANNFKYFKRILKKNKIDEEDYFKLLLSRDHEIFKKQKNWSLIDDIYKETFLPIFKSTDEELWTALDVSGMRISNPEIYNKLKKSGILHLVISKKLKPDMLRLWHNQEFLPEIYSDIELLKKGGSVIKHFTSFDKILSKTTAGDVVSVNGKMFINNNGRLEAWNISEENFNKLFPLVERFTGSQGRNDCFLYSALETMYRNPKTRGQYYKLFEQKGDDILVTIPAYKDFNGTVKFANGKINLGMDSGTGANHYLMLEQAYARTALRHEKSTPIGKNPITTDDYEYLYKRLEGGQTGEVLREFLNFNPNLTKLKNNTKLVKGTKTVFLKKPNPEGVINFFDKYGNNSDLIFNLGIKISDNYYHAISVKSYNPKTKMLTIIDPYRLSVYKEQSLMELAPDIIKIWVTNT